MSYLKYILMIIICSIFIYFSNRLLECTKKSGKIEEKDHYISKETSDHYYDIRFFFARIFAIIIILWSAYELYRYIMSL
ncbi:hypothetical protein SAMN04487911_1256 [Arenibacter nanhaiticus]|uniref:Uncharacterized protein n=1 Tax=Arenibacter nanhaiticus TaxID=558155 RepID=A0A1M6KAI5_9FLAO|nr:hypothetical protein SAMN04487911_1256 [Arenibacter nanhaiticus]